MEGWDATATVGVIGIAGTLLGGLVVAVVQARAAGSQRLREHRADAYAELLSLASRLHMASVQASVLVKGGLISVSTEDVQRARARAVLVASGPVRAAIEDFNDAQIAFNLVIGRQHIMGRETHPETNIVAGEHREEATHAADQVKARLSMLEDAMRKELKV